MSGWKFAWPWRPIYTLDRGWIYWGWTWGWEGSRIRRHSDW